MTKAGQLTWTLSGFGDEIDPDPVVQLGVLQALGARHIEVRSAWDTNVLDLDADQLDRLSTLLNERGMVVSAVASPIGKVDVSAPVGAEVARLATAIRAANHLGSHYIRVFSFYRGEGLAAATVRDDVLERMRALADLAEREDVVLLHENEKDIYGDIPERVLDIIESVGSHALRVTWDSANFVQVGVRPFTEGYAMLRPHLEYLQVKDAVAETGEVVTVGAGDGELVETLTALRDDGYSGFASLEPHLASTNFLGGFSGPTSFGEAARAFRDLTTRLGGGNSMSEARIRVAIGGCGVIGRHHAVVLAAHPRFEVTALVDTSPTAAELISTQHAAHRQQHVPRGSHAGRRRRRPRRCVYPERHTHQHCDRFGRAPRLHMLLSRCCAEPQAISTKGRPCSPPAGLPRAARADSMDSGTSRSTRTRWA